MATAVTKAEGVGGASACMPGLPPSFAGRTLTTQDVRMLKRAVEQGWELPESIRQVLPPLAFSMAQGLRECPLTHAKLRMSETAQIRAIEILMHMLESTEASAPGPGQGC